MSMRVGILGLGEAGSKIAADLAQSGHDVHAWDPVAVETPPLVARASSDREVVAGAAVVISLTTAAHAVAAAASVGPALQPHQVYADLNTCLPAKKREVGGMIASAGALFADVALLGSVPRRGIETPALASGTGAGRFAALLGPVGMPVDVVGTEAGDAAALKLLRSVFMKGLAASVVESLRAAEQYGAPDWLRAEIAGVIGEEWVDRLVAGSSTHSVRRRQEMHDAAEMLVDLGIEPRVTNAAERWFEQLEAEQSDA